MRIPSLKQLAPYGVAVLSVAIATVARMKFDPLLGEGAPLLIFAIAVMLAAWFGGFWPGISAIILSLLAVDYFFFDSKHSLFHYDSRLDQIRALSFVIFGILSSLIFARLRESVKAEKSVRERFRLLVEGVKDYAIFMLDAQGRVASWNPGAERIKGYRANEIIGCDFSVFYTTEDIDDGKPQRVLEIAAAEGRYEESAWQVRRDGSRFWASGVIAATHDDKGRLRGFTIIMRDVTERKRMEEKARFFADLNQALQPLADPGEIMAAAARMLGEYLGVDRCAYAEIEANEKYLYITSDYARGELPSVVGRFSADDLGAVVLRMMRANHPFVADDVEAGVSAGRDLSAYRQAGIGAMICAPLSKNGHYVARMVVSQRTPRHWEPWEVEAVKKVANRCWESVQRARAQRGLRESEERYRAFIANSSEAIWRFELERPIPVNLPEDEQIEMLFKYAYLAECNDAMARMYGYETADQIVGARIGDLLVRSDPRNIVNLRAFKRSGYNLTDSESHEVDRDGTTKYFLNNLTGIVENGAVVRAWGTQRDITERKRAEKALCESEERLRRISEATQDSIWEIDLKTKRLWWNERARPLFGSRPGDLQPGLEDWYDRIHPEDVGRVKARFEKFLRNEDRNWFDEYRFRRADGAYVHILDQGQKFYDESGTPILIAGAMSDITTRVQAEEALRASEERYRLLTEISPDGVVIAGDDGTVHLANQAMQLMLGVAPEQVIGRNLFDFFPPRCMDQYRDCLTDLMTGDLPECQVEIAFRRDDGEVLPAEVSAVRFDWKGRKFAQFIVHDISGRKRAEAERERLHMEIEAERDRLRQILEQMPVGVAIAELPSGRPIFCNREAESLWRHPMLLSDDYGGYAQYGALREDGSPYKAEEYPITRALISGEVVKGEEMRYRRGDGMETFFSVDSAPIYDSEGRRVSAVATFIDIAERKQAEEAIRESEERFAKAFRASPDALVISRISDGVILEVNDSWAELSGYERDELIGKSTIDLGLYADPADRRRMLAILEEQNYVRDFEFVVRRKSGEERLVSFSAEPLELHGEYCWLTIVRDITERRRGEEALRESEERFGKAFRTSPDALVISRISDGVILEANDSFVSLSGYDRDEVIGRSPIDLGLYVDPADRRRMVAILEEQNYVRDVEFAMKRKSGEKRLVSFSAEPLELHGEHCWLTIAHDITESKRAEEALRESEERFAKAFRASPDGLIITRRSDGAILEVNDSWGQMFGYASDEVVGNSWTQFDFLVDPEERRRAKALAEEQNYIRDFEMAAKRKSGETLLVRISSEPIEIRGEPCFVTIIHDITQRKRYEEALRKSEEQARRQLSYVEAIYATAPVGLCFVDTDLTFLSMNERMAEIDGRSVEEHMGRTVREIMPEVADTVEPILRKVIETGEPALNLERSTATARDPGVIRHFIASYYPIKNGGGRVLGVNVVVMEITERKKIEEELELLLRQEKAAREEAESANRMKDEFLATVSHELRTPLTSILGWARMLTGGGLTAPQVRHALEVIAQSAQSQNRLIEDILDTSRIITGRLKLDAQPVVIENIFHAAVDVIRPSAEAKGLDLSEVVDAPDGVVFGDASRLQQAIWNLLSNAVKFTSEGGRIEARLWRAEGQVVIAVNDTGVGIEPRFLPHVFDRFRQADASSTREFGGLGIGLSIVRHIIEMHGGGVSASSPGRGRGATFMIRLPLISTLRQARLEGLRVEAPPPPPVERKSPENGHRLDGVRVLLVEDNPDTLDMLKFIFDESGADVIAATSVDEALSALERFKPDALVSDIAMPDRDGYDLISEIRSREPERGGKIPAVAVTAYARAEDRVRVLAAGFQMHISKPIDPDELIAVVASLTGHIHY
jgi:PAS domain S-box-containing protein